MMSVAIALRKSRECETTTSVAGHVSRYCSDTGSRVDRKTNNASNLFDKTYFTPGFYTGSVLYGYRRTVLATLRYRW